MSKWNPNEISKQFKFIADKAERYLLEVKEKMKDRKTYEAIHDEYLAKISVYCYLYGRTFLKTRESFVSELKRMLNNSREPLSEALNSERFIMYWKSYVKQLLSQYEVNTEKQHNK
ncbi:MAG: hypothetical protein P9X22_05835 [Candidatus Zapsychrus exili]|nr:hypothetical protein [Candidatus Zapsychrus exili]